MRILVGCEYSNTVSGAFRDAGHDAWSCDLLPSEGPRDWHIQGDVGLAITEFGDWDLIILHPPCTALCVAGNRYYAGTDERLKAIAWTEYLWSRACHYSRRAALENPVGVLSSAYAPPDQYIQPWQFGHPETKKTGLWLHGLPPLKETDNVYEHMMTLPKKERHRIWYASPGVSRGKERSRFYPGIAKAMAEQWT
jgi:hypothetical protein